MKKDLILKAIAPCGLNCLKCFAYKDGLVLQKASELKELLGNFKTYAKKFKESLQELENYPFFEKVLTFLSEGSCAGCRSGECLNGSCKAQACAMVKKVEFCADCDEFPCSDHNLPKGLVKLWFNMNNRIKEIGIEDFYKESMQRERYPFF